MKYYSQIGQDRFFDEYFNAKVNIKIFAIENNYQTTEIKDYLEKFGYHLECKLQWNDIFIKN